MHGLWEEVDRELLERNDEVKKMNKMDKADKEVNDILKSIENLSGAKEVLIKTVFLRIGVMAQSTLYFKYNFENADVEKMDLKEVAGFLKFVDRNVKNFQEYIEKTLTIIEDFNKNEAKKDGEDRIQ